MPTSIPGKMAWLTYLIGFWCYLFLGAIAAWPRLPLMAWLGFVSVQAVHAVFWPILVALELFEPRISAGL
jgi:hypothetical protein